MIYMSYTRESFWYHNNISKHFIILLGYLSSPFIPLSEVSQFNIKNCRLQTVETTVNSFKFMVIFIHSAMVGKHPRLLRYFIIISYKGPSISISSKIFPGKETETGHIPHSSYIPVLIYGTMCLCSILNDIEIIRFGKIYNSVHLCWLPIEMNRNNCLCFGCNRLFNLMNINIIGILITIYKHDFSSLHGNGL